MNTTVDHVNRPKLILTDVYGTLLNMAEMERRINNLMNSKRAYTIWSALLMEYCFVTNSTGQFHDFISIASSTLKTCARKLGRSVEDFIISEVLEQLRHLSVMDGVQEGLSGLHDQEFRIAALTNSPRQIVMDRMERTGLISYFETVLSTEQVKKYKPFTEVYKWAASKLGIEPSEIMLVTSHDWDIAGAVSAGMQTAYIKRNRQAPNELTPQPDLICSNLEDLSLKLEQLKGLELNNPERF